LHRPAFALACDLFRFYINRFTNLSCPIGSVISFAKHTRRQCDFSAIRDGKNPGGIPLKFVRRLAPNLNQESTEEKPRAQGKRFGQPGPLG
jgi:hypothetical protein